MAYLLSEFSGKIQFGLNFILSFMTTELITDRDFLRPPALWMDNGDNDSDEAKDDGLTPDYKEQIATETGRYLVDFYAFLGEAKDSSDEKLEKFTKYGLKVSSVIHTLESFHTSPESPTVGEYKERMGTSITLRHSMVVAALAMMMLDEYGFEFQDDLDRWYTYTFFLLHDVGKMDPEIMNYVEMPVYYKKGDPDGDRALEILRKHPERGHEFLKDWGVFELLGDDKKYLVALIACVLDHHQNMNGSGYPKRDKGDPLSGKKGEELHLFARILRFVDTLDAIANTHISDRVFVMGECDLECAIGKMFDIDDRDGNKSEDIFDYSLKDAFMQLIARLESSPEGEDDQPGFPAVKTQRL